jgi:hypothetical protein
MNENLFITHWNIIRKPENIRDEKVEPNIEIFVTFAAFIKALFKKEAIVYPKFYKMDNLSKLGFMGAEILLKETLFFDRYKNEEIAVVIMNSVSSLDTDLAYNETIKNKSNYFPSPSVFVYTLPNIVIGEICIRHKIKGENAFLGSHQFDPGKIIESVKLLLDKDRAQACLCGWVEVLDDTFESVLFLVEKENQIKNDNTVTEVLPFTEENLTQIYYNK